MTVTPQHPALDDIGRYEYGWHDADSAGATARRGLNEDVVRDISAKKDEPAWMLERRLKGLRLFERKPMPAWGADLSGIDFDTIKYFVRSTERQAQSWEDLPEDIKNTYDRLGIPEAEKQRLVAGVAAQYECLRGDMRVWTADRGQVPIKEIEAGDRVFALDEGVGRFVVAPVRAVAQTGVRQTYRVRVGTREIIATDNHPFLVRGDGPDAARWRTLGALRAGDLVAVPGALPPTGSVLRWHDGGGDGPAQSSADLAWLLGVLVGAGSVTVDHGRTAVAIDLDIAAARADVVRIVREQFAAATVVADPRRILLTDEGLVGWLVDHGVVGSGTRTRCPEWIHRLPVDQRRAFGAAVATVRRDDGSVDGLRSDLVEDLASLSWALDLAEGDEHVRYLPVVSIDPADVAPVYDIEVDGPHNFVAEGIVVHNSEVVYHKIREDLEEQGVVFLDTDTGLREHEDVFREYFGSVIPVGDNKFAALNTAVWSGGSFIYVPKGVHVEIPLQAYFRINTENMGQFERTLIIVDEGAYVHYVEGCTAPIYSSDSLHSAVVEIIVRPGARCRYTTIQNWSTNVYNLVTKRAVAHAGATMEWIDGNLGSKVTMKYPAVWLTGEHARGETLSIAFAGEGQHQDAGSKMVHTAPRTSSTIVSKSVARGGGRTSYRGLVQILEGAYDAKATVKCDALLVDDVSRSDTYPYVDVREDDVSMGHEATVSRISADQLFYLMSRGIPEDEAMAMIVRGFVEPIARELPMEYALELNRLIEMQMEGAVG